MQIAINQQIVSRSLAVGLLALFLAAIWVIAIQPSLSEIAQSSEKLDEQRTLLGRLNAVAASRGMAETLEQEVQSRGDGSRFIQGRTEAIRVASLQSLLTTLMTREGGQVRTTRALSPKETDGIHLIGVQTQLVCDVEQLQAMLVHIENSETPLFVDQLQAVVLPARGESTRRGVLDLRIDVYTPVLQSAE